MILAVAEAEAMLKPKPNQLTEHGKIKVKVGYFVCMKVKCFFMDRAPILVFIPIQLVDISAPHSYDS